MKKLRVDVTFMNIGEDGYDAFLCDVEELARSKGYEVHVGIGEPDVDADNDGE